MSLSSMVYNFPALVLSVASSSVNALIHFLTSQLFIPVTNMQKISSLFDAHEATRCQFLLSVFDVNVSIFMVDIIN